MVIREALRREVLSMRAETRAWLESIREETRQRAETVQSMRQQAREALAAQAVQRRSSSAEHARQRAEALREIHAAVYRIVHLEGGAFRLELHTESEQRRTADRARRMAFAAASRERTVDRLSLRDMLSARREVNHQLLRMSMSSSRAVTNDIADVLPPPPEEMPMMNGEETSANADEKSTRRRSPRKTKSKSLD